MDKKIYSVKISYEIPVYSDSPENAAKFLKTQWTEGVAQEIYDFGDFVGNQHQVSRREDLHSGYHEATIWGHDKNGKDHFDDLENQDLINEENMVKKSENVHMNDYNKNKREDKKGELKNNDFTTKNKPKNNGPIKK